MSGFSAQYAKNSIYNIEENGILKNNIRHGLARIKLKNKKHISLIRENLRLMLYRFNPCPQRHQRKIIFF